MSKEQCEYIAKTEVVTVIAAIAWRYMKFPHRKHTERILVLLKKMLDLEDWAAGGGGTGLNEELDELLKKFV